ncbi:MAG: tautomerase family protein [Candidatus Atribacteria bacterium]|nr:tautomerase family protein [Candidatus Atribacteria bacterium]
MPVIIVEMFEGRTPEQKEQLVQLLTEGCIKALTVPSEAVQVVLHDVPRSNWGIAGVIQTPKK